MTCDFCELEHTPELAKSMLTVPELLEVYGFEVGASGKFALRDERTPSTHAYEDHYWDFGSGEGGDLIDLVMKLEGCTFNQALSKVIHKALKAGREPGDVERHPVREVVDFTEQLAVHGNVVGSAWREFTSLNPPRNCKIDYGNQAMLIPHRDGAGCYGVKVRGWDGSKSAWPGSQFTKRLYDPQGWADPDSEGDCVICEGESDCWALTSVLPDSVAVLALPSGASCWKDHWLADIQLAQRVFICMDNDRAGQQAREKIASKVGHLRAEQLRVPPLYNDAREAIAAGWRPALS